MQSTLDTITESKIFKWNDENLMAQLPLKPGCNASFILYLYAATDFIAPTSRNGNIEQKLFLFLLLFLFYNNYSLIAIFFKYIFRY